MSDKKQDVVDQSFRKLFVSFNTEVQALRRSAEQLGPIADQHDQERQSKIDKQVNDIIRGAEERERKKAGLPEGAPLTNGLSLTHDEGLQLAKALRERGNDVRGSGSAHRTGLLIQAVGAVDFLFARILECVHTSFPAAFEKCDRKFTYDEIRQLGSMEAVDKVVLEHATESLIRGSVSERVNGISRFAKIDDQFLKVHSDTINETLQRRHIHVHGGGVVSRQYLEKTTTALQNEYSAKLGEYLPVDDTYLRRAVDRMNLLGVVVLHQAWTSLSKDRTLADASLNEALFNAVDSGRFVAAENIGCYANSVSIKNGEIKRYVALNLAQSYKRQGKVAEATKLIDSHDWSVCSLKYRIAVACLQDDYEFVRNNLLNSVLAGEYRLSQILEWPIFRDAREQLWFPTIEKQIRTLEAPPDNNSPASGTT